jgi:hypothetical protein
MLMSVVNGAIRRWQRTRRPDLGKLVRTARFRDLDAAATSWIDENFRRIEDRAPWLIPAGRTILDFCITGATSQGVMHRGIFSVMGERSVASVYGFDGGLSVHLDHLSAALTSAGWKQSAGRAAPGARIPSSAVSLAGKDPPVEGIWKLQGPPHGLHDNPVPGPMRSSVPSISRGARLDIDVGWAARETPIEPVASLITLGEELERISDSYRPLQVERSSAPELISGGLDEYLNVLAIRMRVMYYRNSNGPPW